MTTEEKPEIKGKATVGCLAGIVSLFLAVPLWYALMFMILQKIEATPTMWVLFFLYVPVGLAGHVLSELMKNMKS